MFNNLPRDVGIAPINNDIPASILLVSKDICLLKVEYFGKQDVFSLKINQDRLIIDPYIQLGINDLF